MGDVFEARFLVPVSVLRSRRGVLCGGGPVSDGYRSEGGKAVKALEVTGRVSTVCTGGGYMDMMILLDPGRHPGSMICLFFVYTESKVARQPNKVEQGPCPSRDYILQLTHAMFRFSPSLVLGHVLSPVRSIPRHSLLLIANYTSELVCIASAYSNFWKTFLLWGFFSSL